MYEVKERSRGKAMFCFMKQGGRDKGLQVVDAAAVVTWQSKKCALTFARRLISTGVRSV